MLHRQTIPHRRRRNTNNKLHRIPILFSTPTPACPPDTIFINAWFGTFPDILGTYGLSPTNYVHSFNRHMHQRKIAIYLDLPTIHPYLNLKPLGLTVPPNTIFVENGPYSSGQCYASISYYLQQLVKDFPQYNFLCSSTPPFKAPNIIDGNSYNLLQLSDLSNGCIALITSASGVNAATYTHQNAGKTRIFFGFSYQYTIWDNKAQVARDYPHLKTLMETIICKK